MKTIFGLALIAISFAFYLGFETTKILYLVPFGLASFGFGFHFALSTIKALQSIKKILTFLVIGILVFWIFMMEGWDKVILNSSYAMTLAEMTTKFTVSLLNFFNIHAIQSGTSVIFPPDSKIHQINILPACAGLDSSAVFLAAFVLMLIDLSRKASRKKLAVIFVIGVASVFFANLMRIAFLSYVAYAFGYDALETNHMYAGFIIFLSLIALFWWLSLRWVLQKPRAQINSQDLASKDSTLK